MSSESEGAESSFAESFCWAVGNLANPDDGYIANQAELIKYGK